MTLIASHAQLGASICERWYECAASVRLSQNAPEPKPSKYAAEGTVAHQIAAEALLNNHQDWIDQDREVDGFTFRVTDEMLEAVMVYVSYVRKLINDYKVTQRNLFVEKMVSIPNKFNMEMFGTADAVLVVPYTRLIVVDYKHGQGVRVNAVGNKQLMYYALGALLSLDEDTRDEIPVVQMSIVQPRCPGGGVTSFEMPTKDLLAWHAELIDRAFLTMQDDAPIKAGPHCKWCPAKVICPAIRDYTLQEAGAAFADVQLPALPTSSKGLPAPADMPDEYVCRVAEKAAVIRDWLNAVDEYLYARLMAGVPMKGWKLVPKRSNRKWIDEEKTIQAVLSLGSAAYKNTLLSPAQMEAVLKKRKDLKVDLASLIHTPDNGFTVAPDNDAREAVNAAARAFSTVNIDEL